MDFKLVNNHTYLTTLWSGLLLGTLGVDHFYRGNKRNGFLKLLTIGGLGFWYVYDLYSYVFKHKKIDDKKLTKEDLFNRQTFKIALIATILILIIVMVYSFIIHTTKQSTPFTINTSKGALTAFLDVYIVTLFYALAFELIISVICFVLFTIIDAFRKEKYGWMIINIVSALIGFVFINLYYYIFVRTVTTKGSV